MKNQSSPKRPIRGVPGVKALITAGALVVTLGGWAMLSFRQAVENSSALAAASTATPELAALLDPLPTLIAAPYELPGQGATITEVPKATGLRVVSTPPAPVTVTRSSR